MNYRLSNFEIKPAQGARISGQAENGYLSCTAFNPMNRFEKPHHIAIFDQATVEHYKALLPEERGGVLPNEGWDENAMKMEDRIFVNGCTVEYDLGAEYCRKYTADIIDANGITIPGKAAGDYIKDVNGNIVHFNKIAVFCQYCFRTEAEIDDYGMPIVDAQGRSKVKIIRDATGRPIEDWVDGWRPEQVGESMRRLLTPYSPRMEASGNAAGNVSEASGVTIEQSPQIFPEQQQNTGAAPAPQGAVQQPAGTSAQG